MVTFKIGRMGGIAAIAAVVCTLAACAPGANDVADEVGKALRPTPDYVDKPAAEPEKPQ